MGEMTPEELTLMKAAAALKLEQPMQELIDYAQAALRGHKMRYWAILDYNKSSSVLRLHVFDAQTGAVEHHAAAHGKNSEPKGNGFATVFSNSDGSDMSCLGIVKTGEFYFGEHGRTLRLDGMSPENSNIRHRAIVMHSANYVQDSPTRAGRSWGCPALDPKVKDSVIDKLGGGSLIMFWHDSLLAKA